MLRVRSFGLAVGASVLFFGGFGAMLLAGVLFLTGVWHEDVLSAGLMLFPGPAMATAFSVPSARLGARVGYRIPGVIGAVLFAAGSVWYITQTGDRPAYFSEYLPGMAISGAGVGLVIPTLTGAGASSLAPERFATGAAVLTMGRQIGAALGVAALVAVLGTATRTASDFHTAWLISVAGGLAAGLALASLGRPARGALATPVAAEARAIAEASPRRGESGMNAVGQLRTRSFSWEDPAATAAVALELSGLESMKAIIDGTLPPPPIARLLDFTIVEVDDGRAVFAIEPAEWMYNPIGSVHGGIAATLLDSCMGCAVHTTLEAGVAYTTADLQVRYIRAMSDATGRVLAEGRVVHSGRRTATAEGRLFSRVRRDAHRPRDHGVRDPALRALRRPRASCGSPRRRRRRTE